MTTVTELEYSCFEVTIEDAVAHIRLKRPQAMNSMIPAFWTELPKIVRAIDAGALARCIVISSTGKHFSAGMDLAVFGATGGSTRKSTTNDPHLENEARRHHVAELQDSFSCLEKARMPVLAAIQGGCVGGAVDLTTACDIRYATADAFFCIQEINIGMTADVGTFPRLVKLIPDGWVREMAYTGRRLPAATAKAIGLVNEVYDTQDQMLEAVMATAREIAGKAPLAVTGSKVMINYARDHSVAEGLDYIAVWQTGMFSGAHMGEAFKAKQEGRPTAFADLAPLKPAMDDRI